MSFDYEAQFNREVEQEKERLLPVAAAVSAAALGALSNSRRGRGATERREAVAALDALDGDEWVRLCYILESVVFHEHGAPLEVMEAEREASPRGSAADVDRRTWQRARDAVERSRDALQEAADALGGGWTDRFPRISRLMEFDRWNRANLSIGAAHTEAEEALEQFDGGLRRPTIAALAFDTLADFWTHGAGLAPSRRFEPFAKAVLVAISEQQRAKGREAGVKTHQSPANGLKQLVERWLAESS